MTQDKSPKILSNVFPEEDYLVFKDYLFQKPKLEQHYSPGFGRYAFNDPVVNQHCEKLIPIAREQFNSSTLVPSYSLFAHYEGPEASLYKHKDDNACTYTLDMCVYQTEPWDLWVEDKNYTLYPNQALAYYGNDQLHWREKFPNPDSGYVAMIFFHFVEPDHWWITKGPSYLEVIRNKITEEEWQQKYGNKS
jgi:hypothetical protein